MGGFALAIAAGVISGGYRLVATRRSRAQREQFIGKYTEQRSGERARVLQDGRVTVRRVHAVAVVKIERSSVVSRDEVNARKGWDEREEVLEMSLDEAV